MAVPKIQCPAGEIVHPVLSRNRADVQCRVQGGLRPAESQPDPMGARKPAVCCSNYANCQIWRMHQEIERGPSTKKQRDASLVLPQRHVLGGSLPRELIRV